MSGTSGDLTDDIKAVGAACFALQARRTANLLTRVYNHAMAEFGLELSQFSTLCHIAALPEATMAEMAAALGVERSTLVRNLQVLRREGLVMRAERGGRRLLCEVTAKGEALIRVALPRWQETQSAIQAALALGTMPEPLPALRALRRAAHRLDAPAAEKG